MADKSAQFELSQWLKLTQYRLQPQPGQDPDYRAHHYLETALNQFFKPVHNTGQELNYITLKDTLAKHVEVRKPLQCYVAGASSDCLEIDFS